VGHKYINKVLMLIDKEAKRSPMRLRLKPKIAIAALLELMPQHPKIAPVAINPPVIQHVRFDPGVHYQLHGLAGYAMPEKAPRFFDTTVDTLRTKRQMPLSQRPLSR
jgi:hypothetical protein